MKKKSFKPETGLLAAASAALALTLFLFAPLQMYIGNLSEWWFSITDVLFPSLAVCVTAGVLLFLFGLMLKEKVLPYSICLLIGVCAALFVQGNFVGTDYGVLNGQAIEWEKYAQTARWNTLLWVGIILLPFAVKLIFKKAYRFCFAVVSAGVILIQMVSLIFLGVTVGVAPEIDEYYLTNKTCSCLFWIHLTRAPLKRSARRIPRSWTSWMVLRILRI